MKNYLIPLCLLMVHQIAWSQVFVERQKTVALDRAEYQDYGNAVAIDGNIAVIGSQTNSQDTNGVVVGSYQGAVYIMEQDAHRNWVQVQKITSPTPDNGDRFGSAVALHGNRLAVGSLSWFATGTSTTYTNAGSVFIYERDTTTGQWNFVTRVTASDRYIEDRFGETSIALTDDYLVVGARYQKTDVNGLNGLNNAGAAYIFKRNAAGQWIQEQKITSNNRVDNEEFGYTLAISGTTIIVGEKGSFLNSRITVFVLNTGGIWTMNQEISFPWTFPGLGSNIGRAIDLDGNRLVTNRYISGSEVVCVYERTSPSTTFSLSQTINPNVSSFGNAIKLDGDRLLIGASYDHFGAPQATPVYEAGSAHIYNQATNGTWNLGQTITASDRDSSDHFGHALALSGRNILVGVPNEDHDLLGDSMLTSSGSAYFFENCPASLATINATVCNASYVSPSGKIWTSSNTYLDTIPSQIGCDSIITINLTVNTVDTGLTINGLLMTANSVVGTYKWYDCLTNSLVLGATFRSFNATPNGSYALIATYNGCTDTSACYSFNVLGTKAVEVVNAINYTLFPNPTDGIVTIDFGVERAWAAIEVFNLEGKVVLQQKISNQQRVLMDLKEQNSGLYFVRIQTDQQEQVVLKLMVGKTF